MIILSVKNIILKSIVTGVKQKKEIVVTFLINYKIIKLLYRNNVFEFLHFLCFLYTFLML